MTPRCSSPRSATATRAVLVIALGVLAAFTISCAVTVVSPAPAASSAASSTAPATVYQPTASVLEGGPASGSPTEAPAETTPAHHHHQAPAVDHDGSHDHHAAAESGHAGHSEADAHQKPAPVDGHAGHHGETTTHDNKPPKEEAALSGAMHPDMLESATGTPVAKAPEPRESSKAGGP